MFSIRKLGRCRRWAATTAIAMLLSGVGPALTPQPVLAQTAPVGNGFVLNADDIRFIFHQIEVAQDHAAGGKLLGPGPNQVNLFGAPNPQLPIGLRTVDGSFNNLTEAPDQHLFGAADQLFPRKTTPVFRPAQNGTTYNQKSGNVTDSEPRVISNLVVDQSANNPAAAAAAANPCGSGGFVCSNPSPPDPDSGALFIPNITPDFGLSAPFNLMFAFFGQFFDHGLDLVTKGGGNVIIPLQPDDPLFVPGSQTNFMVMTRGQLQPGPDGILGTADDVQDSMNTTTPWVDQNQTYTSHPSHQVFLRQYAMVGGRPQPDGKVLDGDHCSPRGTGFPGDNICNIGTWADVKAQAATKLGIRLADQDVFDVPLILTDPYGHFKPGPNGFPQLILPGNVLLEGNPLANNGAGISIPANAFRTGHAFLNDIAHNAAPNPGLVADSPAQDAAQGPLGICDFRTVPSCQPAGTYDNELLDHHFVTGDGRGNENIALTMVHQIFHAEHNRLTHYIDNLINTQLTPAEIAAWHATHAPSGWGYGERLFQAARFVTEMQYQHLVFEEFARKMQPLINPFLGGITSINGAISAEFAHTVYRLGHSMLPERVARLNAGATPPAGAVGDNDVRLLNAFLNPLLYNDGGACTTGANCVNGRVQLTAAQSAGSIIRGTVLQVGNELDEFVTSSVRNTLVGLPLDLAAINIARGRSEGIPPLNEARRQFFEQTKDQAMAPYANWFEFGLALRHFDSLVNFVAAYGTDPTITAATTVAAKRTAAQALVAASGPFMFAPAATSGLNNVDFWVGGLAEKPSVFGGLLGTTFNFIFEHQLEDLQNGDRFYYLQRTDGLNMRFSLEGNSFAELARRNTDVGGTMHNIFEFADFTFDLSTLTGTAPVVLDPVNHIQLLTLADGTKLFFDPTHSGKNVLFNGSAGDDRAQGDVGDDTLHGNAGNDRLKGGEGNDSLFGGDGDDIMFGDNGDDVIEGGPGNDAMQSGPGFGGDILIGGEGNDFMVGGDDGVEYFGGPGNDIIVDGAMRSEGIFGGPGDDWIYDGDGHDGGIFGDNGNVFDLLAGVGPAAGMDGIGGDDVLGGGPGQDNHWGEDGNDIFLMSEGSNKFFGDYGFDFITLRGWPAPEHIELNLLANPNAPVNFNDLRNRYRYTDGASGWDLDDIIDGDDHVSDPAAALERQFLPGMELTAAYANKVTGLPQLITAFGKTLPFVGGNILLGGGGRDTIKGLAGDDLIDGDRWLDVQLRAVLNDGTVKLVWSPVDLIDDVFADPQRLNPGNITIVRTIRLGNPAIDTAVFQGPLSEYTIVGRMPGPVIVSHTGGPAAPSVLNDGTDTLLNVELLQFSDQTIITPGANVRTVPSVANQSQGSATSTITNAGLTVGAVTSAFSTTIPAGRAIGTTPAAGTILLPGEAVTLIMSLGAQDATAPAVSITAPANGATVAGTVNVTATATDNVGVVGVQFLLDGNVLGAEDTTAPYSVAWNTLAAGNGTHVLSARARDAAGNVGVATAITVTVSNDVTPPTVSLTAPANGATVSGTITVSANAADNVAVASVQFQLDGIALGAADTAAPYSVAWNTTTATNASHTLTAVATDTAGNQATSAAVTVTVNNAAADVTPPTVTMTAPANGATVSGTAVTVSANAADNVAVASVQFLLDGVALGAADTTAPYSVTWNTTTAANGTHTLAARATDTSGNAATSAAVTVTVNNVVADVTPPTVAMTAPANGATVSGAAVTVSANATDNVAVASVQFLLDGVALGAADTTAPYSITWDTTTATNATHTLSARATDTSGNAATSATITVTVNNAAGAAAPAIVQNVVTNNQGSQTIVSPTVTPAANTLIVAFVSADAPTAGANTIVNTMVNSGTALTWTLASRSNTQLGTAEVWWAFTPAAHAGMTVTATLNRSVANSMRVVTFSGASPLTGAATVTANAAPNSGLTPTATLTTTRANSLVFMVGTDWDNPRTMVAGVGQTIVGQFTPTVGDTYWTQRTTAAVAAAGTAVTMSATYGATTDRWNIALVEIRTP